MRIIQRIWRTIDNWFGTRYILFRSRLAPNDLTFVSLQPQFPSPNHSHSKFQRTPSGEIMSVPSVLVPHFCVDTARHPQGMRAESSFRPTENTPRRTSELARVSSSVLYDKGRQRMSYRSPSELGEMPSFTTHRPASIQYLPPPSSPQRVQHSRAATMF